METAEIKDQGTRRAGMTPLAPRRPTKIQICLSFQERDELDARARAHGFESVAAFVRAAALNRMPPPAR
jgi:hypothetical protein